MKPRMNDAWYAMRDEALSDHVSRVNSSIRLGQRFAGVRVFFRVVLFVGHGL